MAKKLVIVESPAKAKTIGSILGSDYEVQASIGHIRDLVPNSRSLPEDVRKKWWADYAVDVENGFSPFYEIPEEKAAQVRKLREAMKGKDTLVLATDEDREGEAISWHLVQVLRPPKSVKVHRIAFHEITRDAIHEAISNPRQVDENLVEAQETRRILDRLYGYTLSPVLWARVTRNLSAGRVQSPAVKLIVDREMERRAFHSAEYWDLRAKFATDSGAFDAVLKQVSGTRIATGADFDASTGHIAQGRKVLLLDEKQAGELAEQARVASPYVVTSLIQNEGQEKPKPPFMTTTLQQDANRKFGFSADRTMRIAQTLYEGVDVGGEQVGLITYMRTDSLTLSNEALSRLRAFIQAEYPDCLPGKANTYTSKVRNAQEAHEAIRTTDPARRPAAMARYLTEDQLKLYTLIWQRTLASQMLPAKVLRTEVQVTSPIPEGELLFQAAGKQVLFDGFLRVYSEGKEDESGDSEGMLPLLKQDQPVDLRELRSTQHTTKAPARYTDATLIKKLEEMGIGRPSTYASIISVIVDRGYVNKVERQLVPTFRAFLTMEVLEQNFHELMDLGFTAKMDEELDEIAGGRSDSKGYLHQFFIGEEGRPGLKKLVDERKRAIPYPAFLVGLHPDTGSPIVVRLSKDGSPFLQTEHGDTKVYANIPEHLAPGDLTVEKALELFAARTAGPESIGVHPDSGRNLLLKNRQGYYLEVERLEHEIEAGVKPTWISVPPGVDPRQLTQDELNMLCRFPRQIGEHPDTGLPIEFKIGKYGAYVECGTDRRTVEDWRMGETLDVLRAVQVLQAPRGRPVRAPVAPLREFGVIPGAQGPVRVLNGRFGMYVTDGTVNATLPKDADLQALTPEEAVRLLDARRDAPNAKKRKPKRKPSAGQKRAKK